MGNLPYAPAYYDLIELMFGEVHNVHGPYVNVHGRRTVIVDNGAFRKGMAYSRYLWIMHHKEIPPDGYVVDHIDNDPTNDVIENLQLLTSKENDDKWREYYKTIKDQIVKPGRSTNVAEVRFVGSMVWFNCPYCGTESAIRRWVYNQNQVRGGKAGPYCSKSCSVNDRPKGWASKKVGDLNAISEL